MVIYGIVYDFFALYPNSTKLLNEVSYDQRHL